MAKLRVKYDPTLEQSDIISRLDNASPDQTEDVYNRNQTGLQQTAIYGILCPIIAVNNVMIAYEDIINFVLNDTAHIPTVDMHIKDRKSLIQYLDTPGNDNELRVQILPPFDDVYKKINLTFIITSFSVGEDQSLYIRGSYKAPNFVSSQYKSIGEKSLYGLFDEIASNCKLGFATNVEDTDDKRFIYCPFKSYQNIIENEISHSGNAELVYDWWIDVWNYLNLADMYERYNAIDGENDMKVWISGQVDDISESVDVVPQEVPAELTNLIGSDETQLHIKDCRIVNTPGLNVIDGSDKVYSVYSMNNREYQDTYISDGDVKKDIYNNFEYKGEVYGDFDYITSGMYREPFLQKIKTSVVEADLNSPLLGLQRGNRVILACYYNDDTIDYPYDTLKQEGLIDEDTVNPSSMDLNMTGNDSFKIDNSISGQYLIIGNIYKFSNKTWTQTCILTRPADQKPKILKDEE